MAAPLSPMSPQPHQINQYTAPPAPQRPIRMPYSPQADLGASPVLRGRVAEGQPAEEMSPVNPRQLQALFKSRIEEAEAEMDQQLLLKAHHEGSAPLR